MPTESVGWPPFDGQIAHQEPAGLRIARDVGLQAEWRTALGAVVFQDRNADRVAGPDDGVVGAGHRRIGIDRIELDDGDLGLVRAALTVGHRVVHVLGRAGELPQRQDPQPATSEDRDVKLARIFGARTLDSQDGSRRVDVVGQHIDDDRVLTMDGGLVRYSDRRLGGVGRTLDVDPDLTGLAELGGAVRGGVAEQEGTRPARLRGHLPRLEIRGDLETRPGRHVAGQRQRRLAVRGIGARDVVGERLENDGSADDAGDDVRLGDRGERLVGIGRQHRHIDAA